VAPRPDFSYIFARLRVVLAEAPDHYEILDQRLVARLAGVLFCAAGLLAAVLLSLDPPAARLGVPGWMLAAVTVGLAFLAGGAMLGNRRTLSRAMLLAVALSGPLMIAILQWLSGGDSSYVQLLILSVVWTAVVLPAPRLLIVLLADSAVVFLPAAYGRWEPSTLHDRVATISIAWMLAALCLVWSGRARGIGRMLGAQRAAADELARVDALTGLGNRRALDEALTGQVALAQRAGRPLAALVGDIDAFKQTNDRHGHHAGDRILRDVAGVMRDVVRRPDACFRWGGDEFVVLLPDTDAGSAQDVADRIGIAIGERCASPDGVPVSLTLGAAAHAHGASGAQLLGAADAALLVAKAERHAGADGVRARATHNVPVLAGDPTPRSTRHAPH
jgi:diguanylate cyclase (GGDEF)-like protein